MARPRGQSRPAPPVTPIGTRWWPALVAVFALALGWKWTYLARLAGSPLAGSLDADSMSYWQWSEFILLHGPLPPAPFFLAPLYPYALAAWRGLGGGGMASVLGIQAVLGAAAVTLLTDATRRLTSRSVGVLVGVVLAVGRGNTFFDGLVLPESLLFFLESVLVWFVVRTDWARAGLSRFACYGLMVGVLAQGRASEAVLLALAVPLAGAARRGYSRRLAPLVIAAAGFLLCALPSTLVNWVTSREFIPFTYNLGFNLYVGNNPDADGRYVDITGGSIPTPLPGTSPVTGGALDGRAYLLASQGRALSPAASSAFWAGSAVAFMRSQPLTAMSLAFRKFLLAWNRTEIPQIESMEAFARAAGPLGMPVLGCFAFLAVLGLAGLPWAWRAGPSGRWLAGYVLLTSLSLLPFFLTDRYRHHFLPALAVLAGVFLARAWRVVRSREVGAIAGAALAAGFSLGLLFVPVDHEVSSNGDWSVEADLAIRMLQRGDLERASALFARAQGRLGRVEVGGLSASARVHLASFYFRYGILLEATGHREEAVERWEQAVALNPMDAGSLARLHVVYEDSSRPQDDARIRRLLEAAPGGRGQLLLDEGWTAAGQGDLPGAEQRFLEALRETPDLSMAWQGLIRLRLQTGRFDEAWQALQQGRASGLEPASADIFECLLLVKRRESVRAAALLRRIRERPSPTDPYLQAVLEEARRALLEPASRER